jgi:hypothetical protein
MAKRGTPKWAGIVDKLPKLPAGRAAAIADEEDDRGTAIAVLEEEIKAPRADDDPVGDPSALIAQGVALLDLAMRVVKRSTAGRPWAAEYARAWHEVRDLRDEVSAVDGRLGVLLEAFQELMTDAMENEGIKSVKLQDGRGVTTYDEPFAQVVDKDKYREWCMHTCDCGMRDAAHNADNPHWDGHAPVTLERSLQLPWSTTNSLNKKRLERGLPEAPGVTSWAKTVVRKSAS